MEPALQNKYEDVATALRQRILQGVYAPAARMPAWSKISSEFGVGMATIQRALGELAEHGFVHARPGSGTFVVEHPPHLCDFAIAIPASGQTSHYFTSFRQAVSVVTNDTTTRLHEYICSQKVSERRGIVHLCNDMAAHRLAGAIFAGQPEDYEGTSALIIQSTPRVLIQNWPGYDFPRVIFDLDSYLNMATEYLFSRGRRRVAHLNLDFPNRKQETFVNLLRRHGFDIRPYWLQAIPMQSLFRAAVNVVHLLMRLTGDDRPDALIIHDDNLVEHAMAGLMAAGVKVPEDVEVIVGTNYPSPVASVLPIQQICFDCRKSLKACMEVLQMQQRGEIPPPVTKIPAEFIEELSTDKNEVRYVNQT